MDSVAPVRSAKRKSASGICMLWIFASLNEAFVSGVLLNPTSSRVAPSNTAEVKLASEGATPSRCALRKYASLAETRLKVQPRSVASSKFALSRSEQSKEQFSMVAPEKENRRRSLFSKSDVSFWQLIFAP